jgi:hypothetical protein
MTLKQMRQIYPQFYYFRVYGIAGLIDKYPEAFDINKEPWSVRKHYRKREYNRNRELAA